ncbi:hypothetical protein FB451DRAFT_1441223 [Mycena latifolia]|nr:hypothetical protein FB451DRAFT_1441223 [Mycena latifolia]
MRDNLISQLQSSLLLGALSLIPNDALRYTLLVIAACIALLYVIHLKRPSTQLNQLEDTIQQTEGNVRDAKLHCPRDLLSLTEGGLRLSDVQGLAWPESPGFGLAWAGLGLRISKPKPKPAGRAWPGLAWAQARALGSFFLTPIGPVCSAETGPRSLGSKAVRDRVNQASKMTPILVRDIE